jgi:hypothetical protein
MQLRSLRIKELYRHEVILQSCGAEFKAVIFVLSNILESGSVLIVRWSENEEIPQVKVLHHLMLSSIGLISVT